MNRSDKRPEPRRPLDTALLIGAVALIAIALIVVMFQAVRLIERSSP
jgi:hypothetical protein